MREQVWKLNDMGLTYTQKFNFQIKLFLLEESRSTGTKLIMVRGFCTYLCERDMTSYKIGLDRHMRGYNMTIISGHLKTLKTIRAQPRSSLNNTMTPLRNSPQDHWHP